jgi:outer membrane protein assembly factor BamB
MSFTLINRSFFSILSLLFLFSCSTKTVYEKIKPNTYEVPLVENIDDEKINIINTSNNQINYGNELLLKDFKNDTQYFNNIITDNDEIYAYKDKKLYNFDYITGHLISTQDLTLSNDDDILIAFEYIYNSFLLSFKSGSIFRLNKNFELIWKHESKKKLNTQPFISNEQIILLYGDEIKGLHLEDGSQIWSETYQDMPIYQATGGQVASFFNIIYFILPNNSIGAIDLNFGSIHNSKFDDIPLISSINNTKDKIHIYDNYLVYIDEGKYLYTLDIFKDEFILFKKNINLFSSSFIFNNSIIIKEGNHLQAISLINGKTYWLISDKKISKKSKIVNVRNYKTNIEIFLSNGDVLTIHNKELINITNLDIGKIDDISFEKQNIIIYAKNKKTLIF